MQVTVDYALCEGLQPTGVLSKVDSWRAFAARDANVRVVLEGPCAGTLVGAVAVNSIADHLRQRRKLAAVTGVHEDPIAVSARDGI